MLSACLNLQKSFLASRCGKAGAVLLVAASMQSASADITVAPDFPLSDVQQVKKSDPADNLVQSYRKDVLAKSTAKSESQTLPASKE